MQDEARYYKMRQEIARWGKKMQDEARYYKMKLDIARWGKN